MPCPRPEFRKTCTIDFVWESLAFYLRKGASLVLPAPRRSTLQMEQLLAFSSQQHTAIVGYSASGLMSRCSKPRGALISHPVMAGAGGLSLLFSLCRCLFPLSPSLLELCVPPHRCLGLPHHLNISTVWVCSVLTYFYFFKERKLFHMYFHVAHAVPVTPSWDTQLQEIQYQLPRSSCQHFFFSVHFNLLDDTCSKDF